MNKIIIFALSLCFFQAINAKSPNNAFYNIYFANNSVRQFNNECKGPGLTCKNCETLIFCTEIEPNVFEESVVQTCKTPEESCLLNQCSKQPNTKCPVVGNNFLCTGTGIFPDPYDCSSYHVCIEAKHIISDEGVNVNDLYAPVKCPDNWGYNPVTTYCDQALEDGYCPNEPPIPACPHTGYVEKIEGTSIYFICITNSEGNLRPILHICPHGNVIDDKGTCQTKLGS